MRFIILSPPYENGNGGVRALYDLQKWLIRFGKDAIVVNNIFPLEPDDVAIYPEIIVGNPFNAQRVVRYLLNTPGKIGGDGIYGENDLLVAWSPNESRYSDGFWLMLPYLNPVFINHEYERTIDCFWVHKGRNTQHPCTSDCIEITKSWPPTKAELAALLNKTRTLYSYDDNTALAVEAKACGCIVKLIQGNKVVDYAFPEWAEFNYERFESQMKMFISKVNNIGGMINYDISPRRVPTSDICSDSAVRNWEAHGAKRSCAAAGKRLVIGSRIDSIPDFVGEEFGVSYRKAQELAETGETQGAITMLSGLLDKYPDMAKLHNDLGVLCYRDGEAEKALSHYRQASRLEPDNVIFKKNLADFCFVGLGKSEEAMQIYLNILSSNPRDAETWASLGYACSTMERPADAAFFYGKALEINPLNETAQKGLETVAANKMCGRTDESATGARGLSEEYLAVTLSRTLNKVNPEVSIVIPVFNKVDYTRKCLEMIAQNTPAGVCEIIVIDNASTDETKSLLSNLKDCVKYIENERNLGYAKANNQAARIAAGKYLLFLNNDTEVLPSWLEPLVKIMDERSEIGIAAPKLIYPNGTIQHCGKVWRNVTGHDSHPEHLYLCEPGNSVYVNNSREFSMVTGACIIVRRDEFVDVGMFDENYENGWEDDDLCYAFTSKGRRIFYCAESTVIHHENVTLKESFSTATFKKNRERFFCKWGQMVERDDLKYYIEDGFALSRSKFSGKLEWAHKGTPKADAKSVLVSNLVRGGDVLLTTTLLPEIRKRHPHARITFACAPAFAEILEGNPYVDEIMPFGQNHYSEKDWNKVAELASTYEAAYLAQPIPDLGQDFFTTLRDGNWHLTDIFAAKAGVYHYHRNPELYLKDKDIADAMDVIGRNGIDTGKPYVVFHYAAQDDFKSWNPDEMKKLIQKMHACYPSLQYVLIGGKESESVAGPNLVNVSGKTTILQSAAIISKAECFIGVDSLPAHLTTHQQTPAIILFGGTLQRFCGPQNDNARAIEKSRADMITADDVARSLRELPQFRNIDAGSLPSVLGVVSRPLVTGMTSIVILTFNELKYTRECIESIKRHTPEPHEVIFVDNASKDGTVKWLRKIVAKHTNYRLIENDKNEGFAKGCNQGIEASSGEYILLLNNDVVVTDNWLSGMLECLNSAPDTGIVGPMTNNISGPQKIRDVDYKTMGRMHDYAKLFREMHRYRRIAFRRIVGFCMLFRRQLADKIGLLDTSFGTGNFEDDDYCLRAALAGYRNLVAGDVFIHHYGSRSFIGNRIDYGAAMSGNIKIFEEKWTGIPVDTPLGKRVAALNFISKADGLNQRGQLDKAVATMIEGVKYAPEEKALYYHLAEMLMDEKLYKDALDAVNSMPAGAEGDLKRLEIIAYCTDDLNEAAKYAERMLELDEACAPAWNLKGVIAQKQRDNVAAEGFFMRASESDPGYGAPCTNRGMLKWASGEQDKALVLLEKGFVLSPTATDNVTLYHSAITALEQFERAEKIFHEAKDLHPENKRILFFLIDILIKQDKFETAMRRVEQAMLDIGIDDGMLSAALALREKVGTGEIDKIAKNKGTLSLCMIVKNEEQHLARCLLSAGPAVDEMIVVDTGSTDRTRDIAQAYGARVFDFPWTNDFSEARNYSLSKAVGDWILVLDADEVISPQDYPEFEKIIAQKLSRPVAYTMITRNYTYEVTSKGWTANDRKYLGEEAGTGWFPSSKVRLFINDKRIRFQNPVHEFVEASLEKAGIEIKISQIPVHHYGRFDKDKIIEKGKKYFLLGKKKIEELKGDFKAVKELAIQALELQEYDTSVELWKEAIKLNQTDPDVFLNIGYAYLKLERYGEALDSSRRAMELNPSMKEAVLNYAGCEFLIGDIEKTISVLETLLQTHPDYPSAMLLVAAAYYVQGQKEKGRGLFDKLRKRGFNWTNFIDEQSRAAMSLGKYNMAALLLEVAIETGNINSDTNSLLAECRGEKENSGHKSLH